MLQIPIVSQDDLHAFHARVYGSVAPHGHLHSSEWRAQHVERQRTTPEEEDDLGYYPDGQKRTLTDDQIAMFRHSEIYAILRERQVHKENLEADEEEEPDLPGVNASKTIAPVEGEDEVEHAAEAYGERQGSDFENLQAEIASSSATTKRKRSNANGDGKPYTSRRLARELDSAVADYDCVLDYGDGPSEEHPTFKAHPRPRETSPANSGDHVEKNESVRGRKIWWPTIQPTSESS